MDHWDEDFHDYTNFNWQNYLLTRIWTRYDTPYENLDSKYLRYGISKHGLEASDNYNRKLSSYIPYMSYEQIAEYLSHKPSLSFNYKNRYWVIEYPIQKIISHICDPPFHDKPKPILYFFYLLMQSELRHAFMQSHMVIGDLDYDPIVRSNLKPIFDYVSIERKYPKKLHIFLKSQMMKYRSLAEIVFDQLKKQNKIKSNK